MAHIFVTGGSRGIGAAIVKHFANEGHNVSFTYKKSQAEAEALSRSTGALPICADGQNEQAVTSAVSFAMANFGEIDCLINCAGISSFQLFQDVSTAEWDEMMHTNLRAPFFYIRECLPSMIAKKQGSIINISSIWGMVGASCEVLYSTTKAALIGMTKALAQEVAPSGIRVNAIAPGVIQTAMNDHLDQESKDALAEEIPMGRFGTVEEVAKMVYYFAMVDTYTTGQVISPNGGIVV